MSSSATVSPFAGAVVGCLFGQLPGPALLAANSTSIFHPTGQPIRPASKIRKRTVEQNFELY
jgi:hypothetical protein